MERIIRMVVSIEDLLDEHLWGLPADIAEAIAFSVLATAMDETSIKYGHDPAEIRQKISKTGMLVDEKLRQMDDWLL